MRVRRNIFALSQEELQVIYDEKYGSDSVLGWGPKMRKHFNYFTPEDYYEALVSKLVTPGCIWVDIGCGHDLFPSNPDLADKLSKTAGFLLGIDPDKNIRDNRFITERFEGAVEEYSTDRKFDLITMRMVAEHIVNPDLTIERIAAFAKPGGLVLIYTPNKWAPMSLFAKITSLRVHHIVKKWLWRTDERDTFPVQYKLNTRKTLRNYFVSHGMNEVYFEYVDDCRTFGKFPIMNYLELSIRSIFNKFGFRYPENCILAIYRKER